MTLSIDDMATFCKRRGFVYPHAEIYGGLAGFYDYGPLGVELKRNLKDSWWRTFVQNREDIVGIDGTIVSSQKIWEASGHVAGFVDMLLECGKCGEKQRADHFIEDNLDRPADGITEEELVGLVKEHNLVCPRCKGEFKKPGSFNLMFQTQVGPSASKESIAYLRPETAQLIFTNFRLAQENARLKLPFGIAQMGKAFRNEISPRNFLFRCREFEQMEIEYFINPADLDNCPYLDDDLLSEEFNVLSSEDQQKGKEGGTASGKSLLKAGIIKTPWHAFWLASTQRWFTNLGVKRENLRIRQHLPDELSHYALDTWDLEYQFPFGWKELQGIANRTDFDLSAHTEHSKKDLRLFDDEKKEKVMPHVVAEPSLGVDRSFLVFMFDAYEDDKERGNIVLHLHPTLAPVKIAVFPLVANKEELVAKGREVFETLRSKHVCQWDRSGSVGRRYARQDEIGTPYCVTVDFESLEDGMVTVRDRDSTEQKRIKIDDLLSTMTGLLDGSIAFGSL